MTRGFVSFPEFVWIWNHCQGLSTPSLHVGIAVWLYERWQEKDRRLLVLAFRNSGKSTLIGLFCAWLFSVDQNRRILVLAAEHSLAAKMVRNVKRIIESHPLTAGLKPKRADQWASDQFTIRRTAVFRDPSMLAKGIEANITGLRADAVICDDVEVPNTCGTPARRQVLRSRLQEVEYVLVPDGLQVFVGTPHTRDSIYFHTESLVEQKTEQGIGSEFKRLEIPIVDNSGQSQWPERYPLNIIEEIKNRTGPAKFESQMLLRPRNIREARLDADYVRMYDQELQYTEANGQAILSIGQKRLVSASCWWDPAFGSPNKGDSSVVSVVFTDEDGQYYLHDILYVKHNPDIVKDVDEASQQCRQVAQFVHRNYLPHVCVEVNGIGKFLPGLLRREIRNQRISCAVLERVAVQTKDLRILDAFDAVLASGRLLAHRRVWDTPFLDEMREWRPGEGNSDDGLDAVAGCLLDEPIRLPYQLPNTSAPTSAKNNWRPGGGVFLVDTDFAV